MTVILGAPLVILSAAKDLHPVILSPSTALRVNFAKDLHVDVP